jgi:hypothetical protein
VNARATVIFPVAVNVPDCAIAVVEKAAMTKTSPVLRNSFFMLMCPLLD